LKRLVNDSNEPALRRLGGPDVGRGEPFQEQPEAPVTGLIGAKPLEKIL
jgi:hypothetical protein